MLLFQFELKLVSIDDKLPRIPRLELNVIEVCRVF